MPDTIGAAGIPYLPDCQLMAVFVAGGVVVAGALYDPDELHAISPYAIAKAIATIDL
jgi:hypothetical protein